MITVLRLDHRSGRDARITTHVCLTSRAFMANKVILTGDHDKSVINSVNQVVENWGGDFQIEYSDSYKKVIKQHKKENYEILHLTMYGKPIQETVKELDKTKENKLIIVGGSHVPGDVYEAADWNTSVTTQPHSEVAALATTLHLMNNGKELENTFTDGKLRIIPNNERKKVINNE
ncbi:MAG: tRNA (cytidine(56)-2'-O)-methyltransferase [Methanobacteriaceae archaeon]|nr:tRNA (cytidine(56)-2'-O)-methyltransferase [Methanobacteriaceae archaeon]